MKKILAIILAVTMILPVLSVSADNTEGGITVTTADIISTEYGYDTCDIYFYNGKAFMCVDDIQRYTRLWIGVEESDILEISQGIRNISIDTVTGELTEGDITVPLAVVKHEGEVLLHAYPILTYLGATCGVENGKLIIDMPETTMWEGLWNSEAEEALNIGVFGGETEQNARLFLNGVLSILDSGIFETLLTSSLEEAIALSMQVNPLAYDSAKEYKYNSDLKYSALIKSMIAANDFSADFSDLYTDGGGITRELAMNYFQYAFEGDAFASQLKAADNLFASADIFTSFLSNISANSKCTDDSLNMIRTFSRYVPDDSRYEYLAEKLEKRVASELSSGVEAATETAKVSIIKHAAEQAVEHGKKSIQTVLTLWEKSVDISVLAHKAFYGENNAFTYAEAETACINLLRLKDDLFDITEQLERKIYRENYSNKQDIEDYRLLRVFYYRVLIAANEQCKALIIANGKKEELADTIALLEANNEIFAENLYILISSEGKAFADIATLSKQNKWDSFKELSDKAASPNHGYIIDTPYFTIELPESWKGKIAEPKIVYYPKDSNDYEIRFSEKQSYDARETGDWMDDGLGYGVGGHLVSFGATFNRNNTNRNGSDCCIAEGNVDGKKVYIYRYGPTDIQYTKKGEKQYRAMAGEISKIKIKIKEEYQ